MGSETKEIVEQFYQSNFYKDEDVLRSFLHPEVELSWYGTTGLKKLNLSEIAEISEQLAESFESLRAEIEKIIVDGNNSAIHFTYQGITEKDEEGYDGKGVEKTISSHGKTGVSEIMNETQASISAWGEVGRLLSPMR